jgi:hypothetical protein
MKKLDFGGARIKLARANKHANELGELITSTIKTPLYELIKRETADGDLEFCVHILKSFPAEAPTIIGDAVHNIRCALDHFVWMLVETGGGTADTQTQFPVAREKSKWDAQVDKRLRGACNRARDFVRNLNAYPGGDRLLVLINELDIIDKHRLMLVMGGASKSINLNLSLPHPGKDDPSEVIPLLMKLPPSDPQFPIREGDVIFTIKAAARIKNDTDFENPTCSFCLCVENPDKPNHGEPLPLILAEMINHVEAILSEAERHLS